MDDLEQLLTLLQHGDSFFPSGSVSFSWGLEKLKDDSVVSSKEDVENFLSNQLAERWLSFDRVVLAHAYDRASVVKDLIYIDDLVECMTLAHELREGSKRLGAALCATYTRLGVAEAKQYQSYIFNQTAYGHLTVVQALIWKAIGLQKNSVLTLSAYSFCVAVFGAALRLGLVGHIDCQNSLNKLRTSISEYIALPVPDLEHIHAFTPFAEIASMRHESSDTRLFAN